MFSTAQNRKRFTDLGREEKGKEGDRGDLLEKKKSKKGERAIRPVKMGPVNWVLKGTKLITNTNN